MVEVVLFPFVVLLPLFFMAIATVFWVWMIIDCAVNEPATDNNKIVWIIIILFTYLLGALIYFVVRRPQRLREMGR